jgi:hypothetical protein
VQEDAELAFAPLHAVQLEAPDIEQPVVHAAIVSA